MKLIDLHLHSLLSDGELLPSELARRAEELGYETMAITDHVDWSNLEEVIPRLVRACEEIMKSMSIRVLPGAELTHVPPPRIAELARKARGLGAKIIVAHGETLIEPVRKGTNLAAIESGEVDILAHPGLITPEETDRARENGVYLELTSRAGHCYTNGWVARRAKEGKAKLLLNSDAHAPEDLLTPELAAGIVRGAGVVEVEEILRLNPLELLKARGIE
jgi:histidinol phosphatase-like PHP family hydrolase